MGSPTLNRGGSHDRSTDCRRCGWVARECLGGLRRMDVGPAADVPCRLVHAIDDVNTSLAMAGTAVVTEALQLAALAGARAELGVSLQDCVPRSVVDAMVVSRGSAGEVLEAVVAENGATML